MAEQGAGDVTLVRTSDCNVPLGVPAVRPPLDACSRSMTRNMGERPSRTTSPHDVVALLTDACRSDVVTWSELLGAMGRRKRQRHRWLVKDVLADVKGDLTGISKAGSLTEKLGDRLKKLGLPEPTWGGALGFIEQLPE